jgi:hypothetical protein
MTSFSITSISPSGLPFSWLPSDVRMELVISHHIVLLSFRIKRILQQEANGDRFVPERENIIVFHYDILFDSKTRR